MNFLEAYTFMSENKDNVCLRDGSSDEYKVISGDLMFIISPNQCTSVDVPIHSLNKSTWEKVVKKRVVEFYECVVSSNSGSWISWRDKTTLEAMSLSQVTLTGKTRKVEVPE